MKRKLLNLALILFSLIGYLEWGQDSHKFLFEIEIEVISKMILFSTSILHPLVILPLIGQIILIYTLFQKKPSKILTYLGLGAIGILILLMFFVGIISSNFKIILSTLPFIITGLLVIINNRLN